MLVPLIVATPASHRARNCKLVVGTCVDQVTDILRDTRVYDGRSKSSRISLKSAFMKWTLLLVSLGVACLPPPPPVNNLQSSHPVAPFDSDIAEAAARMDRDVDANGLSAHVLWVGAEQADYVVQTDALGQPTRKVVTVQYVFEVRRNGQGSSKCYLGGNESGYAELSRAHLGGGRYGAATLTPSSPLGNIDDNVAHRLVTAVECRAVANAKGGWRAPSEADAASASTPASTPASAPNASGSAPTPKPISRKVPSSH
jgi:hypothetical protein